MMNDFKLDKNGDVVIAKDDVQLVSGKDLTVQKVNQILGTNKGEWELDSNEGINMRTMLTKNPNEDEILDNVLDGLMQVDETFRITEYEFKTTGRNLCLNFHAETSEGEEIELTI